MKTFNKTVGGLLVMGLLIGLYGQAVRAQQIQGVTIDTWPPFMYQDQGKLTGIATEVVQTIFDKAGVTISLHAYPWARAYAMALNEPNAMIFTLFRTPEREALFHWVGPIVPAYDMYFYKLTTRTDITIRSLEDAKRHKIGVIRDVANHKYLVSQGFEEGKNLDPVTDPDQNIKKLFAGRIDLLINSEFTLPLQLKSLGLSYNDVEKVYSVLEADPGYMGFQKDTPKDLVQRIEVAFQEVQAAGTIEAIQEKYLKQLHAE